MRKLRLALTLTLFSFMSFSSFGGFTCPESYSSLEECLEAAKELRDYDWGGLKRNLDEVKNSKPDFSHYGYNDPGFSMDMNIWNSNMKRATENYIEGQYLIDQLYKSNVLSCQQTCQ